MNFICYENGCEGVYSLRQLVRYYCDNILQLRENGYNSFGAWLYDLKKLQILIEVR